MSESTTRPSVVPLIWYAKPRAAIPWLEKAFGFEPRMIVAGDDGESVIHSELGFGSGAVYVVGPSTPGHPGVSPVELGGRTTQHICVNLADGLDAICERARGAGARIQREPADQPYGDRVFTCEDLEQHTWSFSQPVVALSVEEIAQATGHSIETPVGCHG